MRAPGATAAGASRIRTRPARRRSIRPGRRCAGPFAAPPGWSCARRPSCRRPVSS